MYSFVNNSFRRAPHATSLKREVKVALRLSILGSLVQRELPTESGEGLFLCKNTSSVTASPRHLLPLEKAYKVRPIAHFV